MEEKKKKVMPIPSTQNAALASVEEMFGFPVMGNKRKVREEKCRENA